MTLFLIIIFAIALVLATFTAEIFTGQIVSIRDVRTSRIDLSVSSIEIAVKALKLLSSTNYICKNSCRCTSASWKNKNGKIVARCATTGQFMRRIEKREKNNWGNLRINPNYYKKRKEFRKELKELMQ